MQNCCFAAPKKVKMYFNSAMTGFCLFAATVLLSSVVVDGERKILGKNGKSFVNAMEAGKDFVDDKSFMQRLLEKAKPMNEERKLGDENQNQYYFDMGDYSLKYAGCQSVLTWSDEQAEDEDADTVFVPKRFVIFRLCPSDKCNKYSITGCQSDYGQYLIQLDDYIATVSEYYEAKYQSYCAYCQPCYANGQAQDDDARMLNDAADDDAAAAGDDAVEEGDDAVEEEEDVCDEERCSDSFEKCYYDDDNVRIDVREFLGCVAVEDANGDEYYLSPYCQSDGFSVTLGVFSDDACMNYVGDDISVYDILGFDIDAAGFSGYFPRECTSCMESDNYYADDDANAENGNIYQMCEDLYYDAGKCNKNFDDDDSNAYQSANQAAQENSVCNYIESLLAGDYNEDGEIVLEPDSWWYFNVSNWQSGSEYLKELSTIKSMSQKSMKPWQIFAMITSVCGCLYMWIWACCLHGSLSRKNIPWRPRRDKDTTPGDISRQNSGIVLGRSSSGQKTTPLI